MPQPCRPVRSAASMVVPLRQACNEVLRQEAKAIGVDLRRFPDCANTFPVPLFKIPVVGQFEICTISSPLPSASCMLSFSGSRGMSSMFWLLQFYRVNPDGTRTGGYIVNDPSSSVELASAQAQSMMRNTAFPWGRANLCLIKSQYGSLVCEEIANAHRP
jgi:hypothetical protein